MSTSEISANSPLPVTVTNFASGPTSGGLPAEFKEGTKWRGVSIVGSPHFTLTIKRIVDTWVLGDVTGDAVYNDVWLNFTTVFGFAWQSLD